MFSLQIVIKEGLQTRVRFQKSSHRLMWRWMLQIISQKLKLLRVSEIMPRFIRRATAATRPPSIERALKTDMVTALAVYQQ